MTPDHHSETYAQVDISDRLDPRAATDRLRAAQLVALAQRISERPNDALAALVELALKATGAHGSGLSLAETARGEEIFRWVATDGLLAGHLGGTMPRWFSPCGDVLRRNALTLMREPVRHYPYMAGLGVPVHEVLLAPFCIDGVPQGTVWVMSRDAGKTFDSEDGRALVELARFVSESTALLQRLNFGTKP